MDKVPASAIPHSVISLFLDKIDNSDFFKELLATRNDRSLQRVDLGVINDRAIASAVGELVGTDPTKPWSIGADFRDCGTEFCAAAMRLPAQLRHSSLTELEVCAHHKEQFAFATLLSLCPNMRSFKVDFASAVSLLALFFDYSEHTIVLSDGESST